MCTTSVRRLAEHPYSSASSASHSSHLCPVTRNHRDIIIALYRFITTVGRQKWFNHISGCILHSTRALAGQCAFGVTHVPVQLEWCSGPSWPPQTPRSPPPASGCAGRFSRWICADCLRSPSSVLLQNTERCVRRVARCGGASSRAEFWALESSGSPLPKHLIGKTNKQTPTHHDHSGSFLIQNKTKINQS